ncbi:WAS/WASL-interacting protein family member 2-like [Panicum virgatum]|uniref:WAS/WASL-interacting protein family member 2-like n=1 Tax=Panicum virgatum TaxID=38727 RepID=UPI0019D5DFCB|nr:WAS/WASL-interacting protein family member 2-like [Panicum virgatum]
MACGPHSSGFSSTSVLVLAATAGSRRRAAAQAPRGEGGGVAPPLAPHRPPCSRRHGPVPKLPRATCAGERGGISSRPLLAARSPLPPPRAQAVVHAIARRPPLPDAARASSSRCAAAPPLLRAAAPPPCLASELLLLPRAGVPLPRAGRAPPRPSRRPSSSSPATPPLSRRALLPNSAALRP